MPQKKSAPDTLPSDFDFNSAPDTLPASFDFGQSTAPTDPTALANQVLASKGISVSPPPSPFPPQGILPKPAVPFASGNEDPVNRAIISTGANMPTPTQLGKGLLMAGPMGLAISGIRQSAQNIMHPPSSGQMLDQMASQVGANPQSVRENSLNGDYAGLAGNVAAPLLTLGLMRGASSALPFGKPTGQLVPGATDQAANLAAAADTGGAPKAGVSTYQDHAVPGLQSFQDALSKEGIQPSDFTGRQGPQKAVQAAQSMVATAQERAAPYLQQIQNRPVGDLAEQVAQKVESGVDNFDDAILPGSKQQAQEIADAVRQAKTIGDLNTLRSKFNILTSKYWSSLPLDATTTKLQAMVDAGNALRDAVYGTAESVLGVNLKGIKAQEGAGLALERQFTRSQNVLDRVANTESAPPSYFQRIKAGESGTEMAKSAVGLNPPSKLDIFNTQMQRVAHGVNPMTFQAEPVGAPGGVTFQGQPAAGIDVPAFLRQKGITLPEYQQQQGIAAMMPKPQK